MSKKKSGATRKFPLEKLEELFEEYKEQIVIHDEKILRPGDPFWEKFKKEYNIESSAKSIYTDAKRWQSKICESEKKEKNSHKKNNGFDNLFEDEIEFR